MITVVGSLNMDLFIETPHLPRPGETVLGKNLRRTAGGKGANQALAAVRMGAKTALIGMVGHDLFGGEMVANLAAAGVGTDAILRRKGTASGMAMIAVDPTGQNQIVVAPGANATLSPENIARQKKWIYRSRAVIAQLEIPLSSVEAALRFGRKAGALTILNPAPGAPLTRSLLRLCDWIVPNETEAEMLTGVPLKSLRSAAIAAQALGKRAEGANVVITLGARGAWIHSASFIGHVPGFTVRAVDAVGAGDMFVGAFVTRLVEGTPPLAAARFACAAAAIVVTRRGAQAAMPTRAAVNAWVEPCPLNGERRRCF
jgi:ribokinase